MDLSPLLLLLPVAALSAVLPYRRLFWTLTALSPALVVSAGSLGITAAVALGVLLLGMQAYGHPLVARKAARLDDPALQRRLEGLLAHTPVPAPEVRITRGSSFPGPAAWPWERTAPERRVARLLPDAGPPLVLLDGRFVREATADEVTGLLALQLARLEAIGPPPVRRLLERSAVLAGLGGAVLLGPDRGLLLVALWAALFPVLRTLGALLGPDWDPSFLTGWAAVFPPLRALRTSDGRPDEVSWAAAACGGPGPVAAALARAHRVVSGEAPEPERMARLQEGTGTGRPLLPLQLGGAEAPTVVLTADGVRWAEPDPTDENRADVFVAYDQISRIAVRGGPPPALEIRLATGGVRSVSLFPEERRRVTRVIAWLQPRLAGRS